MLKTTLKRALLVTPLLLVPFFAQSFSVHLGFSSLTSGHEEVSRQATLIAIDTLEQMGLPMSENLAKELTSLKPVWLNKELVHTENPLIRGNYAADKPDKPEWIPDYGVDIRDINGFPSLMEFEGSLLGYGDARSFHFTLNEEALPNNKFRYQTAKNSCTEAKSKILDFSNVALESLVDYYAIELPEEAKGKSLLSRIAHKVTGKEPSELEQKVDAKRKALRKALFSLGVATHTIQDSFSPSHTFRAPFANRPDIHPEYVNYDILDVCWYDQDLGHVKEDIKNMAKVTAQMSIDGTDVIMAPEARYEKLKKKEACDHGKMDENDFVWISAQLQNDIVQSQNWKEWEAPIFERIVDMDSKAKSDQQKLEEMGVAAFCRHQHYKDSNFKAFTCLKHEARLARTATAKYLLEVFSFVMSVKDKSQLGESTMKEALAARLSLNFFNGTGDYNGINSLNEIMPQGVMRCDQLPETVHIRDANDNNSFTIEQ